MDDHTPRPRPRRFAQLDSALRFLTIAPLPWPAQGGPIGGAVPWFPLIGALIGAALVGVGWAAGRLWPPLVAAALMVVTWGLLTGGLHLDGLSDSFDALMSWRSRERKLEIMKDSRIGAMGALALIAALLLKVVLLAGAGAGWWRAALLAPILGRWAMLYAIARFPAAQPGGLGSSVQGQPGTPALLAISVAVAGVVVASAGVSGIAALLLAGAAGHLLGRWWTRALGGLTGDTYGAICELVEVGALAALSAQHQAIL